MKKFLHNHDLVLACVYLAIEILRLANNITALLNVVINYNFPRVPQIPIKVST